MYLVDNTALRDRCGQFARQHCGADHYEYAMIESEMNDDPSWPPVSPQKVDLASIFQRLDSVHQIPPSEAVNGVCVL